MECGNQGARPRQSAGGAEAHAAWHRHPPGETALRALTVLLTSPVSVAWCCSACDDVGARKPS